MSLISFIRDAGERLFGRKEVEAAVEAPDSEQKQQNVETLNKEAGRKILAYVQSQGLKAKALDITFDGATATVSVYGVAPDQATREKILLAAGNVEGVEKVKDNMQVDAESPRATFYTVVKGDTLSKIAKQLLGDANAYPTIFEANRPMLTHPDKIYPGQVLRVPAS